MGRSPGKWIKTVLFGKKSSRSNLSKGKDNLRSSHEKEALVSSTTPAAGLVVSAPLISQTEPIQNQKNGENTELEQQAASNLPRDGVDILPGNQGTTTVGASNGADRIRQEQAATKAQAAFRGYLARRAFRALMGIIRLQALVRGHLVRRQAVATLCCVQGIVKFQALVRGQREDARVSKSCGSHSFIHAEKLLANSFICKLLASSPNAKPLCLQYELAESNSAWSWLERWTKLRVWALPQRKKVVESKSITKPKRSVRRVSGANVDNASNRSVSASDKPKRSMRKISSNPVDIGQEGSQNELEKVKRSLRKVSNSTNEIPDHKEVEVEKPKRNPRKISGAPGVLEMGEPVETEKPKHNPRKASGSKSESTDQVEAEGERLKCIPRKSLGSTAPDVPDQDMGEYAENKKDAPDQLSKDTEEECIPKPLPEDEIVDVFHGDHSTFDSSPLGNYEKDENSQVTNGKLISKEDQASNENQKASRRRASLPAKQELVDTGLQNSPKVPSYMAATESVKAKLRAQGSPKPVPDVADQNGLTRRHSLPSSINGKMSSLSPRTQRPQANSKGVIKHDRSILSSKDGNEKVSQVEWKR